MPSANGEKPAANLIPVTGGNVSFANQNSDGSLYIPIPNDWYGGIKKTSGCRHWRWRGRYQPICSAVLANDIQFHPWPAREEHRVVEIFAGALFLNWKKNLRCSKDQRAESVNPESFSTRWQVKATVCIITAVLRAGFIDWAQAFRSAPITRLIRKRCLFVWRSPWSGSGPVSRQPGKSGSGWRLPRRILFEKTGVVTAGWSGDRDGFLGRRYYKCRLTWERSMIPHYWRPLLSKEEAGSAPSLQYIWLIRYALTGRFPGSERRKLLLGYLNEKVLRILL